MDIVILGSTGSIGTQTLDVVRGLPDIRVRALSGHTNIERLTEQAFIFKPDIISVSDEKAAIALKQKLGTQKCTIVTGMEGLIICASYPDADVVVNALVGKVGLRPTLSALQAKKHVALANKETLVTAGSLVMKTARENNVRVTPIDSEHSAILQCLQGNADNRVSKILLTASGGPFRLWKRSAIQNVKAADALRHPTWQMGAKITIDCATLMNKGLELIEAQWLFGMDVPQIEVLVHPQSIIHSMVAFEDGAVMAQLGAPDMRIPIQYALTQPRRVANANPFTQLDLLTSGALTFERPDMERFPCLALAIQAAETGGTLPAVMNAVNEYAVAAFLRDAIGFYDISQLIEDAYASYTVKPVNTIEDILEAERWASEFCEARFD